MTPGRRKKMRGCRRVVSNPRRKMSRCRVMMSDCRMMSGCRWVVSNPRRKMSRRQEMMSDFHGMMSGFQEVSLFSYSYRVTFRRVAGSDRRRYIASRRLDPGVRRGDGGVYPACTLKVTAVAYPRSP